MAEEKQIRITPDTSIAYIDNVLAKFNGTRDDHKILEASMSLIKGIVNEWKDFKKSSEADDDVSESKKVQAKIGVIGKKFKNSER